MLGFVGLALLAGFASASVALVNMRGWYAVLTPPPLAPKAPVSAAWGLLTLLYVLMAVAAWLVWRRMKPVAPQRLALNAWGWQLAIGAAWPAVFFGFHDLFPALVIAAALIAVVGLTVWRFSRLDGGAALLLTPFLAWASFTGYLNAGFWWFNH